MAVMKVFILLVLVGCFLGISKSKLFSSNSGLTYLNLENAPCPII